MASLPPRTDSQRRPPQRDDSSSSQSQQSQAAARRESHSSSSTTSAVLLNPDRSPPQIPESGRAAIKPVAETAAPASAATDDDAEPRKCWICFNDETEDDPNTSEWRSPCPCVLVAHERCLLDWIADLEAPSARRRAGARKDKILCPQCKHEIKLQRPRSFIVDIVRAIERVAGAALLPGIMTFAGTATVGTMSWIGRFQTYQIFGPEDAYQILGPLYQFPYVARGDNLAVQVLRNFEEHWRLHLGLPLIPTLLIASRTRLADSFLPFIPLIFFVGSGRPQDHMVQMQWPPSAAFTIATLPYIRGLYNAYYDRVWAPLEQKWLKEVQPRAGSDNDANNIEIQVDAIDADNDLPDLEEFDNFDDNEEVLEVEIDMDIFADWMNGNGNNNALENPPVPIARGPAAAAPAPQLPQEEQQQQQQPPQLPEGGAAGGQEQADAAPMPNGIPEAEANAAPAPNIPRDPHADAHADAHAPNARRNQVRRQRGEVAAYSTLTIADTILGAMIFPSIAAAMGEALRLALPKALVTPPSAASSSALAGSFFRGAALRPTGILQTRWGRSIIGGCLFVGLKDAVMLYVRWKMAQMQRHRTVLDYEGKGKGRRRGGGANATRVRG